MLALQVILGENQIFPQLKSSYNGVCNSFWLRSPLPEFHDFAEWYICFNYAPLSFHDTTVIPKKDLVFWKGRHARNFMNFQLCFHGLNVFEDLVHYCIGHCMSHWNQSNIWNATGMSVMEGCEKYPFLSILFVHCNMLNCCLVQAAPNWK